ncbi:MAG: ABC transporter ATP-binding protein [bacterium]|nr:ABC transporter ATP-binding protein [bacterium]
MSSEPERFDAESTDEPTEEQLSAAPMGRIFGLARPQMWRLLAATALMFVGNGISIVTPWVAGNVVDAALIERSLAQLNFVVGMLISLFAIMGALTAVELTLLRWTGALMLNGLRRRLFSLLVTFAPDFYESRRVGELLSRMGSDLELIQETLTVQIPSGVQAGIRFVGTVVILLVLQTRLTLVAMCVVPPVVLVAIWFGRRLEKITTKERDALADTQATAEETLSGIRTVQAFTHERLSVRRYKGVLDRLLGVQTKNAVLQGGFAGTIMFAAFSAFGVVLWYGGRLMLEGELTPGELTSFLLYTFSIAASVGELGSLYAGYRELRGASARVFALLDTRSSIEEAPDARPLEEPAGHLVFRDVVFSYPTAQDRRALDGIDLEVKPGEMIGLVGPSGSGKSTLFSLLLRMYEPTSGDITIDGTALRSVKLFDLRQAIGIVPQDIFLFGGSVEENILFGRPDATPEDVRRAAEAAGADEFIRRLPQGYKEVVGERGIKLSGGQRQRIAIARAFLKNPSILLLDEATTYLDPEAEEKVQTALSELLRGRTTLVIAHRLATAREANRILVVDGGRIVGSGAHDELFESNEIYRHYWELQSLERPNENSSG